jgi:hypothetical protein
MERLNPVKRALEESRKELLSAGFLGEDLKKVDEIVAWNAMRTASRGRF